MTKKFLTCSIITILLFLSTSFCFAAEENKSNDNKKSDLGSELTDSMNKIEKTADDLLTDNDNDEGTAAGAITDDRMNDDMNDNTIMNNDGNNNENYDATRTSTDTDLMAGTTMDGTTWVWIILAVVGVVILATIWVYAMQNTGND